MSISFDRRKRACVYQIDGGFDTDKTVAWMMREYANDETVLRAKYPEKLCRNIVTIGGSGRERDLNFAAFEAAFREIRERNQEAARKELADSRIKAQELQSKVVDLQDEVRDLERQNANYRILALTEGRPDAAEEAVVI